MITPPNFGSGGGSCFPLIVVVALGEPGDAGDLLGHGWQGRKCESDQNDGESHSYGCSIFLFHGMLLHEQRAHRVLENKTNDSHKGWRGLGKKYSFGWQGSPRLFRYRRTLFWELVSAKR